MHEDDFFAQQGNIVKALAHALVNATPETWNEATLEIQVDERGLDHVIASAEHPDDIVIPTDEIFAQTMALQDLFVAKGQSFKTATIHVFLQEQDGKESWKFKVNYTY
jgi:hypothetical protein